MSGTRKLGFIGGSGIYNLEGLTDTRWVKVETPWGLPSDDLLTGTLHGVSVVFLPRHGRGHVESPSSINYRANIAALKMLGVTDIIALSACGSFKDELSPGTFVLADQFIDRTFAREKSFFGKGCVAHVGFGHPVCEALKQSLAWCLKDLKLPHQVGGTYLTMEGPQFSTLAESKLYQAAGLDVIGMTAMPEAKLAREAEIPYALVAMVTDYDAWHPDHDSVTVEQVIKVLHQNGKNASTLVDAITLRLGPTRAAAHASIERALDTALMTSPDKRDPILIQKLKSIAPRLFV